MKTLVVILALIFVFFPESRSQDIKEKTIETTISSATVYLAGAEIFSTKQISLAPGRTKLIFPGLSPKLDPKSIRVTINDEKVDVLGISSQINYLLKNDDLPKIKILKDSLTLLNLKIQDLNDETDALNTEKKMLLSNISIGGQDNGVSIADLKLASDFYRTRISEINTKLSKINDQRYKWGLSTQRIQNQLNELNAVTNYSRSEISILVSVDVAITTDIDLKYLVSDAGWSPSYDIKATDTDAPVKLEYRAKVFNNTDIDWNNIKIKLSTADPNLSVTKPILNPWYLNFQTYAYNKQRVLKNDEGYLNAVTESEAPSMYGNVRSVNEEDQSGGGLYDQTVIVSGDFSEAVVPELSAEFDIKKTYSIPSDDSPYLVDISEHELPASYSHFAVTKLDRDVFLLARITGWEDLNLIEGPANVYYAGTYLGQSFIDTRNVKDTLDLSLGRDSKVIVTRTKMTNFSSTQFIGTKRKETLTYQLIAKNNRKSDVSIQILDQIPISQTDEIEVKVLDISGAIQNLITGELKWEFVLKPGESKTMTLSFEIKYPKDKSLELEQKKSKQIRYFY